MEQAAMTNKQTRRAILAGAAALPALAIIPAAALAAVDNDPIFAAIAWHKAAYLASMAASRIQCNTVDVEFSPEYDPIKCEAAQDAAWAANADADADDAAEALATIRPTTIAGLLALMHHVEQFNAGAFALDIDLEWRSAPMHWPAHDDESEIDLFGYSILANVRTALAAMTVQS
jgi:hypothetical protein